MGSLCTEMLLGSIAAVMTSLVKCKTNQDLGTDRAGVKWSTTNSFDFHLCESYLKDQNDGSKRQAVHLVGCDLTMHTKASTESIDSPR